MTSRTESFVLMNTRAVALAAREPADAVALELPQDDEADQMDARLPQLGLLDSELVPIEHDTPPPQRTGAATSAGITAAVAAHATAGDPIRLIVNTVKRIETLLEQRYGASGRGLHTKVDSVREALPADLVKQLRWIATMRNKTMHEDGFVPDDMPRLHEAMLDCIGRLEHVDEAAEPLASSPAPAKAASTAGERAADSAKRVAVQREAQDDEAAAPGEPKKQSAASAKRDARAAAEAAVAFRRLLLGLAVCTAIVLAIALS